MVDTRRRDPLWSPYARTVPTASWDSAGKAKLAHQQSMAGGTFAYAYLEHSPSVSGRVGIFIPKGFDPSKPAVIISYQHGWQFPYAGKQGYENSIMAAMKQQNLATMAGNKNVVFLIPELGAKSQVSGQWNATEASKYLAEGSRAIADLYAENTGQSPDKCRATLENASVGVMSYSGGYRATAPLLQQDRVKYGMFMDCFYGNFADKAAAFTKRGDTSTVAFCVGTTARGSVDKVQHGNNHITLIEDHGRDALDALGDKYDRLTPSSSFQFGPRSTPYQSHRPSGGYSYSPPQ